jgi:hypothetical protein
MAYDPYSIQFLPEPPPPAKPKRPPRAKRQEAVFAGLGGAIREGGADLTDIADVLVSFFGSKTVRDHITQAVIRNRPRKCWICDTPLTGRLGQMTCSPRCRKKAQRQMVRAGAPHRG